MADTIASAYRATQGDGDAIIIRSTRISAAERRLVDVLRPHFGTNIIITVQSASGPVEMPQVEGAMTLCLTQDDVRQAGLALVPDWGWRCGDYIQILVANRLPKAKRLWMIEPDIYFNFANVGDFFSQTAAADADFLAIRIGDRPQNWPHRAAAEAHFRTVQGCLYGLTRMSRRAIETIAAHRKAYGAKWARLPQQDRAAFMNDESFVINTVRTQGLSCRSLEEIVPWAFHPTFKGFTTRQLLYEGHLGQMENVLLHPVLDRDTLLGKLPAYFGPDKLDLVGYYTDLLAEIGDKSAQSHFADLVRAAIRKRFALSGRPSEANLWRSFAQQGPVVFGITGHHRAAHLPFARARNTDFSYTDQEQSTTPDFGGTLPYASDFKRGKALFVDTPPKVLEDPFLYLSQYANATRAIAVRQRDLVDVFDQHNGQRTVFIFSIGRCGSTITAQLARAGDYAVFSECDAFANLPGFQNHSQMVWVKRLLRRLLGALHVYADGKDVVLKMKAQSNRDVGWFLECFPKARFVFLSRALEPWCRSQMNAFDTSAEQMAGILNDGVAAQDLIQNAEVESVFARYEDIETDPLTWARRFYDDTLSIDAIKGIIRTPSQEGWITSQGASSDDLNSRLDDLRHILGRIGKDRKAPVIYDALEQGK